MLKTIAFVLLVFSQSILADDLYRCGNTFQDTPCKTAASSKPVGKSAVKNSARQTGNMSVTNKKQTSLETNDDCKQRGESAKKIMRMREAGKTVDDQLKAAPDSESQALINEVYKRNGSSFQVQNAIERECAQQKQKTKLTSKWMAETKRLLGIGTAPTKNSTKSKTKLSPTPAEQAAALLQPTPPSMQPTPVQPASSPQQPAPVTQPATAQPGQAVQPAETAQKTITAEKDNQQNQEDEQGVCSSLKAGLENIASQKRKGGNAAYMKDLKQQQNHLEGAMKSAGC
ncbi:MAG: hypothetical protein WBL28_11465 [Methylotenera sp.]